MDVSCFGVHKGGRCPPRTASLQRAKRLTTQSAGVPGLHVPSSLAVPSRALPFMLVCHFVYAYGIHEPVSIPELPAHPVSPSSAPASPQQRHYRGQVSKPMRWRLKARAKENKNKRKRDRQSLKSAPTMRGQGPRPHWVLSPPTVPLFTSGRSPHSWLLRPPSTTCRERGGCGARPRTIGSVAPPVAGPVTRIHDRIPPELGPKPVTRPWARGVGTRPTVTFLPVCQRAPRLPVRPYQ